MSKISSILGGEQKLKDIRIRKFELGGHTFKVRIPLVAESDSMYAKITPDQQKIDKIYSELTASLMQFKDKESEDFKFTDDDVIVEGRSMRQAAKNKAMIEARVIEYIKLLVPEDAEQTLENIIYEDIEAEFPFAVQMTLVKSIGEVISPSYEEARGN
ncbi:MAG: hypothetical protein EBQ97_00135 [Bacteroidetes bacterium]|nr:hypothetical protein [Bacteroidota bacterium]